MRFSATGLRLLTIALVTLPLAGCFLPIDFAEDSPRRSPVYRPALAMVAMPVARPSVTSSRDDRLVATPVALTRVDAIPFAGEGRIGVASYYGSELHGRRKANGEIFNMHEMTAAHPSLPFGTRVKVTNLANGKSVVVRISDRGPFTRGRMIDVSHAAAEQLDFINRGVARVRMEKL